MAIRINKISHGQRVNDIVYGGDMDPPVLIIGAGSYCTNLDIRDYEGFGTVYIGRFCSLAENVCIMLHTRNHHIDTVTTSSLSPVIPMSLYMKEYHKDLQLDQKNPYETVRIGNDVWIGDGARILNQAIIGDGAVIGTNAVVTKNVPPYAIVAGNPARIVRYRFSEQQIAALTRIAWWSWDFDKIQSYAPLLLGRDIDRFIKVASVYCSARAS